MRALLVVRCGQERCLQHRARVVHHQRYVCAAVGGRLDSVSAGDVQPHGNDTLVTDIDGVGVARRRINFLDTTVEQFLYEGLAQPPIRTRNERSDPLDVHAGRFVHG